jgi:hypothetical protein
MPTIAVEVPGSKSGDDRFTPTREKTSAPLPAPPAQKRLSGAAAACRLLKIINDFPCAPRVQQGDRVLEVCQYNDGDGGGHRQPIEKAAVDSASAASSVVPRISQPGEGDYNCSREPKLYHPASLVKAIGEVYKTGRLFHQLGS